MYNNHLVCFTSSREQFFCKMAFLTSFSSTKPVLFAVNKCCNFTIQTRQGFLNLS